MANAHNATWAGFDAAATEAARQSLQRKLRDDPDFWSVVGLPELGVYEALASRKKPELGLAAQLPTVLQAYDDLHQRAGSAHMWGSVFDQADFVLQHFNQGHGADAKAAVQLLSVLRGYAER